MSDFDPRRRVAVSVKDIERARFWYEVRLYLKVLAILAIPTALALWLVLEGLKL